MPGDVNCAQTIVNLLSAAQVTFVSRGPLFHIDPLVSRRMRAVVGVRVLIHKITLVALKNMMSRTINEEQSHQLCQRNMALT